MADKPVFVIKKRISLVQFGEGWQDAYVTFSPFTFRDNDLILRLRGALTGANMSTQEAKEASDEVKALLEEKFIEGKGFDGTGLVEITKDSIVDLPMEIIIIVLQTLQGATVPDPKVSNTQP